MKRTIRSIIFFLLITLLSLTFRLNGFNWDQGQHQHPDERFLTMVAADMKWPNSLYEYFDTKNSTLNPHNIGHSFYVYGTYPVIFTKWVSDIVRMGDYAHINIVGRILVALIDTATAILVFVIVKRMTKNVTAGLCAMAFYAVMMLPIQLSHFFTVDPYATFFITLTFFFFNFPLTFISAIAIGITFGLVVGSKISGILFAIICAMFFLKNVSIRGKWRTVLLLGIVTLFSCYLTIRISYPILFASPSFINPTINPEIIADWKELSSYNSPDTSFPPGIQWIPTLPVLFPVISLFFLGLGIPISLVLVVMIIQMIWHKKFTFSVLMIICWITLQCGYQGIQFVKSIRYFSSVYPFIAMLGGIGMSIFIQKFSPKRQIILFSFTIFFSLLWPVMYMAVYSRPYTRVRASEWIYENIPQGTSIGIEHWDDGLPLCMPSSPCGEYPSVELPMFAPDNDGKWNDITNKLTNIEYIFLSSNRVYGAITGVPERFPITTAYYRALFEGSLGFDPVASFISRPTFMMPVPIQICVPIPFQQYGLIVSIISPCSIMKGIQIIDDFAEETWTVYDHPAVYIFKNSRHYSADELHILIMNKMKTPRKNGDI